MYFYCTILSCSICHLIRRKYAAQKKNEKTAEIYGWNSRRYVLVVWLAGNQPDTFVLRIADNRRSVMILVELDSLETSSKHIKILFALA